ncbi:hypothetical protein BN159_3928 [Streptomyces davaonensis JCM 4913]|uniref:Uncharacterized protein n=1 Tax=Streptomyces davaonensis (strain DSM 101723 / JCM 4913 / KCC S-0913 / 768) TaxID=1214101 RepID=K4R5E1_STRDJ|nr:hypothetical protein [Streptomyces davaonensis]CCK28307.1 hypothetical protein BN159_3928 [Streptomyces davaonensis JCM 4913]
MSVRSALRRAPMIGDIPGLRLLRVGDDWDLVRMPAETGFLTLAHLRALGAPIGPVLYDGPNERLYYAIQTGTTDSGWDGLPVRHLSSNSWLVAPGLELMDDWFGGWCELPDDDTLTDPDVLRAALQHSYVTAVWQETPSDAPL